MPHPLHPSIPCALTLALLSSVISCGDAPSPEPEAGMRWPGPCTKTVRSADGALKYTNTFRYDAQGVMTGYTVGFNDPETGVYEEHDITVRITPFEDDGQRYVQVAAYNPEALQATKNAWLEIVYQQYTRDGRLVVDGGAVSYNGEWRGDRDTRASCLGLMDDPVREQPWSQCDEVYGTERTWHSASAYTDLFYSVLLVERLPQDYQLTRVNDREITHYTLPAPWGDPEGSNTTGCDAMLAASPYRHWVPEIPEGQTCPIPFHSEGWISPTQHLKTRYNHVNGEASTELTTTDTHRNPLRSVSKRHESPLSTLEHGDHFGRLEIEWAYNIMYGGAPLGPASPSGTTTYTYECWDMEQHNTAALREAWRIPKPLHTSDHALTDIE